MMKNVLNEKHIMTDVFTLVPMDHRVSQRARDGIPRLPRGGSVKSEYVQEDGVRWVPLGSRVSATPSLWIYKNHLSWFPQVSSLPQRSLISRLVDRG